MFNKLDKYEIELIHGFLYNINKWFDTVFIKGDADLQFMDNSMKADYKIIKQIFQPKKLTFNEHDSLDDIFNF